MNANQRIDVGFSLVPRASFGFVLAGLACSAGLVSCGGGSGLENEDLRVRTTSMPAAGNLPPVVGQNWFVYFTEEALVGPTGADLNGDGAADDQVAVAVKLGAKDREFCLGVAAQGAAVLRNDVWLDVDEATDGTDWDADGAADDRVLLHWSSRDELLEFVDTLDEGPVLEVDERVYYASAAALGVGDVTNLRYLQLSNPLLPVEVANAAGGGAVRALILGADDDLLVTSLDEAEAGADLNGDGDSTDEHVLALLEAEKRAADLQNIGLALADGDAPWAQRRIGDDWLFAVLVNEAAQGANLNDESLFGFELWPSGCPNDGDTDDDVLHFVCFPNFSASGNLGNTGLAGGIKVAVVEDYVATLCDEGDDGCDFNGDGDTSDVVVRWAEARASAGLVTVQPPRETRQFHAVATGVPGGSFGLVSLEDRFVSLVDEALDGDKDGKPQDHVLLAWIDPDLPNRDEWTFEHQASNRSHGTAIFDSDGNSEPFAGAAWMAAEARGGRVGIAFQEAVPGTNPLVSSLNNNVRCTQVAKDVDLTDELPVWLDFESGPTLDFDGVGLALVPSDAGLVISLGFAYFRVSEAADSFDLNQDGDMDDVLLVRNPLISCDVEVIELEAGGAGGPAVFAREFLPRGAAFFSSGVDFDGDGLGNELVVRHFLY